MIELFIIIAVTAALAFIIDVTTKNEDHYHE